MKKVVVVGGGAAGIMAAYTAAEQGDKVILLEKNEKLGKKLYITGKGRCNITNDCLPDEFLNNVCSNSKFLMGTIYSFTPNDLQELLMSEGLKLKTERGNRVFPASDKSSDVIKCFSNMLSKQKVDVRLNETVLDIITENNAVASVVTNKAKYLCDKVVIATGGKSYSLTGSTGDGYVFAKRLGHTVTELRPSLSAIQIKESFCAELAGLSLKNVTLSYIIGKKTYSEFGEMLFTHHGISGPIVLTLSARINKQLSKNDVLYIDFKPALTFEQLDARVLRDFEERQNKVFKNSLDGLLPKSMIPIIVSTCKIDADKPNNEITREERLRLVETLKAFKLTAIALAPLDEAIVTAGGVSVSEINPKTLESKLVKGLYFAGELIDVDALTGGFNLQIAFATGRKVGLS